ncbi:MAG TPA: sulfotransferase [Fimbriimonadaceae bacterium]|jgi:tetratricopeptide (TPR) repeat protein
MMDNISSATANSAGYLVSAAENAFRAGHMGEVERLCNRALAIDPYHVQALHLLRIILNGKGDVDNELDVLKRILNVAPDHVESLNAFADAVRKQGQPKSGIEPCLRAIQIRPNYANAHNTLGLCYFETGQFEESASSFERAISYQPGLAAAYLNLGAALKKLNKNALAMKAYDQAVRLAPHSSEAQEALGTLLLQQQKPAESIPFLRRTIRANPNSARAHLVLAEALWQEGENDEATQLIHRALAINPDSAVAYGRLGFTNLDRGQFESAMSDFEKSISLVPVQAEAYLGLVLGKKVKESDQPLVQRMAEVLLDPELTIPEQAQLHSALGKAYDDLGQYELAMRHVDEGNRIALGLEGAGRLPGSEAAALAHTDKTIRTFTPEYYRQNAGVGLESDSPIFIVGLPRSGTTLMEQILSSHSQVAAGGELRYWGDVAERVPGRLIGLASNRNAARAAAEDYIRRLALIGKGARFVTDKYNDNFFHLGFLHLAFPNARIINCRRNPIDNCISMYMTPFRNKTELFRRREDILEYYEQYVRLMDHWRSAFPPERMLDMNYEETVANHEEATRKVIAFCGLGWEDSCLKHEENRRVVHTASKWQARQPIYSTSVERWRRYEPWLGAFSKLIDRDDE